jgi:hypothetical protein
LPPAGLDFFQKYIIIGFVRQKMRTATFIEFQDTNRHQIKVEFVPAGENCYDLQSTTLYRQNKEGNWEEVLHTRSLALARIFYFGITGEELEYQDEYDLERLVKDFKKV